MAENFCQRLVRLRVATGLSQPDFAKRCNMPPKKLEKLETCTVYVPSWDEIKKLAKALKAEPLYLATGDDFRFPLKKELIQASQRPLT